jgi:hypothetical protein
MKNSEVNALQGVLEAILMDYLQFYPDDAIEVGRDLSRLALLCRTRGLGVFLLDLPAYGKHFDQCLASGVLTISGLPCFSVRWKDKSVPKLFSGLIMRVFDVDSGSLLDNLDVNVIAFLRQIFQFAKGYRHECSRSRTVETVKEFFQVDREIVSPSLTWDCDTFDPSLLGSISFADRSLDRVDLPLFGISGEVGSGLYPGFRFALQCAADVFATQLGQFECSEWNPRHGPGAVADLPGSSTKYSFPNWPAKLDNAFPLDEFGFLNYAEWAAESTSEHNFSLHEPPTRLISVPKTAKAPRLIAAEPVAHQWCQQSIARFVMTQVESTFLGDSISFKDQTPSRDLALQGSTDGRLATIDLSAASDRISPWCIERLFRANEALLIALHASRSRWIRNEITRDDPDTPKFWKLRKFTTMGSACTFPIQSVLFGVVATAVILFKENKRPSASNLAKCARKVRVFGDDIIVPTKYLVPVIEALEFLRLKVNREKTFGTGRFRESCGMDAYGGYDVTPCHVNSVPLPPSPERVISAVDSANNFHRKFLVKTAAVICGQLPHWVCNNLMWVQPVSGQFGLVTFSGDSSQHLRKRWNEFLQRWEAKCLRPRSKVLRSVQSETHSLFQYFTERPLPDSIWERGRVCKSSTYLSLGWEPIAI